MEGGNYRRTISLHGRDGYFDVSLAEGRDALLLRIAFGDPQSLFFIVERVRAMFDLNADWSAIVKHLRNDPILRARVEADPGIRVPGCWNVSNLPCAQFLANRSPLKARLSWLAAWQAVSEKLFAVQRASIIFSLPLKYSPTRRSARSD